MPNEAPKFPAIDDLFFAVCQTAIKNTAWKYQDFEKVKFVEGQLEQLREFTQFIKQSAKVAEKPADAPVDPGVEIKAPAPAVEKTLDQAVNDDDAFGDASAVKNVATPPVAPGPTATAEKKKK